MTTPQVSVIIPTCNRPGLLPTAIRSVLGQTFGDFELVIVDDASDNSIDGIANAFKDKRVRWIRHDHRLGAPVARNTGIRNTQSEFVAFLDDDDEWYPEKLARQVALLVGSHSRIGAVYTGYDVVDRDTGKVLGRMLPGHRGDVSSALLHGNCVGPTSSFLLRRKCFEVIGMFDESLPSLQDYDLWIRLSRAFQFDYVSAVLFKYRAHSQKISRNPEAIRKGLDILVQKYGTSETFRKTCSEYYLSAAVQFCELRKSSKARQALRCAISLNPFDARYYWYFVLSFLNQHTYHRVLETKARILACLASALRNEVCKR